MNYSGDAAEQIVKMSLEGVEVAARITGAAAKEVALLLIAALKNDEKKGLKLKGRARLASMLRSGKPLEIYSLRESDLLKFVQGAKEYGIVYCVLRNTKNSPDGLCDIMVKADDAPKIGRLAKRFEFATVDKAKIESEIVAGRAAKEAGKGETAPDVEPEAPDVSDTEKLLDDLMGTDDGKAEPDVPDPEKNGPVKAGTVKPGPARAETERTVERPFPPNRPSPRSGPISGNRKRHESVTSGKPSVKEEIREITAGRKAKEAEAVKKAELQTQGKPTDAPEVTRHKQPQRNKSKSYKSKGSR